MYVDNATLLRAVLDYDKPCGVVDAVLYHDVIGIEAFRVIRENELLRTKLLAFLLADQAAVKAKRRLEEFSVFGRVFGGAEYQDAKFAHQNSKKECDAAFREFEMLRRLICYNNRLLAIKPTEI